MVTLITDKLRQQTLEEISSTTQQIQSEQLKQGSKEREVFDNLRKSSKLSHQHRPSRTDRNIKFDLLGQDDLAGNMADSTLTRRCNSYPPAKKRLCRSLSDPKRDLGTRTSWNPEPSSIWTPVKPNKSDGPKPASASSLITARSLEFANKETSSWSTPPESPIPRPVSANSALEDCRFFPLRLIREESDNGSCFSPFALGKTSQPITGCSSLLCPMLPRSHSHPSFSSPSNNGLKRRLSEVDIPRPALDFDKMKATSFANISYPKRTVRSPKYLSKRLAPASSKTPNLCRSYKSSESIDISTDLDSSFMITPTASPTSIADVKTFEVKKCTRQGDENANIRLRSFSNQKGMNSVVQRVDTDLDIKLIEEDGTLIDEIHNATMLFS